MIPDLILPVTVQRRGDFLGVPVDPPRARRETRDSPPPPAASAAGGWGSPSPACTYGRVGWEARRRRRGEDGAGGGRFGVGEAFSGGAAPGGSPSPSPTCGGSRPGVALDSFGSSPDPRWRRVWRLELRAGQAQQLLAASTLKTAAARWRRRCERALAVPVHRLGVRRCAAAELCGVLQQERCSRGVVRRRTAAFVLDAGGSAVVPVPANQIYAMNDTLTAEGAAADYESRLNQLIKNGVVALSPVTGFPKFDLMLLGMGPDGHIASLFPGHPIVHENQKLVTYVEDSPKPPPERITFTFPVINSSTHIALMVTGAGKAGAVHKTLSGKESSSDLLPVEMIEPQDGEMTWFTDKLAVSMLSSI